MSDTIAISDLLVAERVAADVEVRSKKRAIEEAARLLTGASPELTHNDVFDTLIRRERLGTTALGHGVAIPHGRLAGLTSPVGALLKLHTPVEFDAADSQPVDLVFALLVPENCSDQHLQILARLAEIFRDAGLTESLRQRHTDEELFRVFVESDARHATA